jgi:large repetitive protein
MSFRMAPRVQGLSALFFGSVVLWLAGCGGGGDLSPTDPTGSLTVTATTSGADVDPDGYTVTVDAASSGVVTGTNSVDVGGLVAGDHAVGLSGIADNCQVEGDNPRVVTISSGEDAAVRFSIVCTAIQPGTGTIRVNSSTSGADPDADGFLATLDGAGAGIAVPATGSAAFPNVAAGAHTVTLSGVASNCSVAEGTTASTSVAPGVVSDVSFSITCSAIPPTVGSIRVTTATTGPNQDADGYRFAIDGGSAQAIGVNATATVDNLPAGTHRVRLSGLSPNCTLAASASREVPVTGGQTADVTFSITCVPPAPSAARSVVLANPKSVPTGATSTITVTVKDASGGLLAGVAVSLSSTGTGNTITAVSSTTDAKGVATFTFSSSVAENKTITATAGGVVLSDTEVITVIQHGSTTEITGISPETSTVGEDITVTVQVTGEGGGIPTGTVAIFSFEETGGCDDAPLNGEGIATCTFPLNVVGAHTIQAAYSGDDQFADSSDPDGQAHEVVAPAP